MVKKEAELSIKKPVKKVAIVGTSRSSMSMANNLDDDWTIYCLNEAVVHLHRYDLHMEIHDIVYLRDVAKVDPAYFDIIAKSGSKTMLQQKYVVFPECQVYPIDEVTKMFGVYFNNTAALLLAYAMYANPELEEIKIYGIDMSSDTEYRHQRPCMEYYIGYAKGRGIKVTLPDSCPLAYTPYIYGFQRPPTLLAHAEKLLSGYTGSYKQWEKKYDEALSNEKYYLGCKDSLEHFMRTFRDVKE
jgi:hypothetical protein